MKKRTEEVPFDIRERRAMVSLGPLSDTQYCPYMCPFCYVQGGFLSYRNLDIPKILEWLKIHEDEYDIIYISGDTDTFAPPRTEIALEFLESLISLNKDVLFTTRAVLNDSQMKELKRIVGLYTESNLKVYGCVSITTWSIEGIEPSSVPSPMARIEELRAFKAIGIIPILAMRPFIPIVPLQDYETILENAYDIVRVVLGECWYVDQEGVIERRTLRDKKVEDFSLEEMPFDDNKQMWKKYSGDHQRIFCEKWCQEHGIGFFMRSLPAIKWLNEVS